MKSYLKPRFLLLLCVFSHSLAWSQTPVQSAAVIPLPAKRIISLAPHITELLYAAGAGSKLVGNVDYGDYPPEAKALPKVGGYTRPDLEAILALKPDLIIAWQSGNPPAALEKLKAMGIAVHVSQPDRIEDVAREIERFGVLAGTESVANPAAVAFRARHAALATRFSQRPVVEDRKSVV